MDIQNFFNSQQLQALVNGQNENNDIAVLGNDLLDQIKEILVENNKVNVETSNAQDETTKSLSDLTSGVKELVSTEEDDAAKMETSISALTNATTKNMASDKTAGLFAHLKNGFATLKQMAKLAAKDYVQNTKVGKLWTNISKEMKKQGAAKTKVIEGKRSDDEKDGGGGETPTLNSKLIAVSMAAAAFKALNPVTLVLTFLTKVLPLIIIFGLLLYGFIRGFMDGTVADAITFLVVTIVAAVLAFVIFMYGKQIALFAIQVACELMKVAIEAGADWFIVGIIVAVIAVIALAFLVAAGLVVIIIGAAILGIVVGMYFAIKAIKSMMEDMIEDIIDVFAEQIGELRKLIMGVLDVFNTLVPMMANMMTETASTLETGMKSALSGIAATFGLMTDTMNRLASEISSIFNGLAAAILSSSIMKAVTRQKEEMANMTIQSLTAEFDTNPKLIARIANVVGRGFLDVVGDIISNVTSVVNQFIETVVSLGSAAFETLTNVISTVVSLFEAARNTIINGTLLLISKIIRDVNIITSAFVGLLFSMPLVGWLMGLVGSTSFSDALAPLTANAAQIRELTQHILDAIDTRRSGYAKSQSITNTLGGDETTIIQHSMNTISPTDGAVMDFDTMTIQGASQSNFVTAQAFSVQMRALQAALQDVTNAIYKTAPKDSKGGLFDWL